MSHSILEIINAEFDFDDEEIYLIAESIIKRVKVATNK